MPLVVLVEDTEVVDDTEEDAPEALVVVDDDDNDDDDADELEVEVEVVADVLDDVVPVSGSVSSPNTLLPPLRSSPIKLNVALFSPSIPSLPVRILNQHGVADVKLSCTATVAVNPGAFCW